MRAMVNTESNLPTPGQRGAIMSKLTRVNHAFLRMLPLRTPAKPGRTSKPTSKTASSAKAEGTASAGNTELSKWISF